jgi:tetratricopeptide (TPR) repeat protein
MAKMRPGERTAAPNRLIAQMAGMVRAGNPVLLCSVLAVVVAAVFLPALRNDFVNYDDQVYVTRNRHVQGGLTWEGVRWAFATGEGGNWNPVTWISHMNDCQWFGLKPWGHHLTSVLLHIFNTLLLFLALQRMTRANWRSFFVAALFGVHPLHVESVAWAAERKDVLSAFFWMVTLVAYVAYVEKGSLIFYVIALISFMLGLMSKPMVVTLPFVLLLLDWWPLGRRGARVVWEKAPFILLAAASSVATYVVQRRAGAMERMAGLPFVERIQNALVSYCRYLGKFFFPVDLAVFYPHPGHWPAGDVVLAGLVVLAVTVLVIVARRQRYLAVGWLWFLGTLIPVIGLVQVGEQSMADRYTYIPLVGVLIAVTWGISELTRNRPNRAAGLPAASAAVIIACGALSREQVRCWRNSETLFRHAIAATTNNHVAYLHLGDYLVAAGRSDEAVEIYRRSIQSKPSFMQAHNNLGAALIFLGRPVEAIPEFEEAVRLQPDYAGSYNGLGVALEGAGRYDEAIRNYEQALALEPDYFEARSNLGNALARRGRFDEAISQLEPVVKMRPDSAEAHCNLATALAGKGRLAEAIAEYREALRLRPGLPGVEQRLRELTGQPGH